MYYRLKEPWAFRGWKGLPYAVTAMYGEHKHKLPFFFDKTVFLELLSYNGEEDVDTDSLSKKGRKLIQEMLNRALLDSSATPLPPLQGWQRYYVYPSRFLISALWSITDQCNYRCHHCLLSAPKVAPGGYGLESKDSRGRVSNALTLDGCLHIAKELASCGIKQVDLTGGEPLMRTDMEEIVKALTSYQIDIGLLFTNGALLTEKTLDIFERYNQHPVVQVSYDGKGHHDWMRGISGAEQKVNDAFRLLTERKFEAVAAMCIHKENRDCLRDTVNYLASVGVYDLRVNAPQLLGMWRTCSEEYALTEEEVWETYRDYIGHFFEDGMPVTLSLDGYFQCPKGSTDYEIRYLRGFQPGRDWSRTYYCGSMQSHIYITAEGRILPCMGFADTKLVEKFPLLTENSLGDITREGFWKDITDTRIMNLLERNPECAECEYLHDCGGGCMTQNMTEEGDFLIPDSRICFFFKKVGADAVKQVADQAIRDYQRDHTPKPVVKAIHATEVNHER